MDGVATAPDGSLYLVGTTHSFGTQPPSVFLLKYDASGSLIWERGWEVSGFFPEAAGAVAVAADGSVYVTGQAAADALILKYAPDGTLLWQRAWGGAPGVEAGHDIAVAPDDTIVVVGETRSFGQGEADVFVLKLDDAGNLIWQNTWGTVNVENDAGVAVGPDGTIHLVSVTLRPVGLFQFDAIWIRFDAAGLLIDQTAVSAGDALDARGGVAVAPDGSVYIAGGLQEPRDGLDAILLKFTPGGVLEWDRRWGGRSGDEFADVVVGPDGTVHVSGTTDSFGSGGGGDAVAVSIAPDAKVLDATAWGGTGLERGDNLTLGADGSVVLGAVAENPPWVLTKASSKLSRLRATTAPAGGIVAPAAGTIADATGVTFVPGGSTTYAGGHDAVLLRLTP
ncbi:MAG TPA: hypothetical protein VIX41_13745 [Acidimicrobiales bacterium]